MLLGAEGVRVLAPLSLRVKGFRRGFGASSSWDDSFWDVGVQGLGFRVWGFRV